MNICVSIYFKIFKYCKYLLLMTQINKIATSTYREKKVWPGDQLYSSLVSLKKKNCLQNAVID